MDNSPGPHGQNLPGAGRRGITVAMLAPAFIRYLTHSEEDERWRLVSPDAGHIEVGPNTVYPPHKDLHPQAFKSVAVGRTLAEYQIIYITRGRGIFRANRRTHVVLPGSIMVLFPGV